MKENWPYQMAMRAINRGELNSEELTEGLTEIGIAEKIA